MEDPILSESDRAEVQKLFGAITGDVFVDLYTKRTSIVIPGEESEDDAGPVTEQLLGEVAGLSPHIKLTVHDATTDPEDARTEGVEGFIPAIVFRNATSKGKLRYFGLPAGYEFKTLIDTLVSLGANDSHLSEESRADLAKVTKPVNLKVYVTPG